MDTIEEIDAFESKLGKQDDSSSDEEPPAHPQIADLHAKIDILCEQIVEKDEEIQFYKQSLGMSEASQLSGTDSGDYTDQKLAKLRKQNRLLKAAIEAEKNRAIEAMLQVKALRTQVNKPPKTKTGWKQNQLSFNQDNPRHRYFFMEKRYQDLKFKLLTAKTDLKKAKRVIQREIGTVGANWKGRHQQIQLLTKKIEQLKKSVGEKSKVTTFYREELGSAQQRRKELEALQAEITQTQENLETSKKKTQGASSRKIALEKELRDVQQTHKKYLNTLLEKNEFDKALIAELKNELNKAKKAKGLWSTQIAATELNQLTHAESELEDKVSRLKEEIADKRQILEMFQECPDEEGRVIPNEIEYKAQIKALEAQLKNTTKPDHSLSDLNIKELTTTNARHRAKIQQLTEDINKLRPPLYVAD